MSDRPLKITVYAAAAIVSAAALSYIFAPSIFPDDERYSSARKSGAVGLSNPANDCFINSVLQALVGLRKFRAFLNTVTSDKEEEESRQNEAREERDQQAHEVEGGKDEACNIRDPFSGPVTGALKELLDCLDEKPKYKKTISASPFIKTLESVFKTRISRQQQDAQEFLQILLERLSEEYRTHIRHGREHLTSIQFPFEGSLRSSIECQTCSHKPDSNLSPFLIMTLTVPSTSSTTLDDCLNELLTTEMISGYKCERCDSQRLVARHTRIENYPEVLVLHLSRSIFSSPSSSTKNNAQVLFPETLVLGGFSKKTYKLRALLAHKGGHDSGHYKSFRRQDSVNEPASPGDCEKESIQEPRQKIKKSKKAKEQWWRISDHHVGECDTRRVLDMKREAYLVFYELIGSNENFS